MRRLSSLAWRSLLARRLRTFLTTIGIALGVGVLFAALATNAAVDTSVDRTVSDLLGNAQLRVSAFQEVGLSAATQAAIAGTPGVAVAAPQIERRTYLQPERTAVSPVRSPVTVLGIDPTLDAKVHALVPIQGTVFGPGARAALISETLAQEDGLSVGSTITILGPFSPGGQPPTFVVGGILAGGGPLPTSGDRIVVIPIEYAAGVFGLSGVTRVDVVLAPGTSPDTVSGLLEDRLRTQPYILSAPGDVAASLRASTADFQATTALIAAISLFVGALLIFNTLSMTVVERIREVALLRAAGATRSQVQTFVLLQAVAVGLLGSVLGVGFGWLLSAWLGGLAGSGGGIVGAVPLVASTPSIGAIALAIGVGFAVTLAAAIEPAWRAGRIPPIEALRQRPELGRLLAARLRWLVVVFVVVGIAGLLLWPRTGGGILGSFLIYALLLVVTLLSPLLLPALGRLAGLPFAALLRAEERLARGTLIRERSRTALTVGSLTIGLAMVVALAAVGQNDRRAATGWLADVVPGDELATSIRPIPLEEGVQNELAAAAGVARVTPIARFDLAYKGVRIDGAAIPARDLLADGRLTFTTGDRANALGQFDDGGRVLLPKAQADRLRLRVGDHMSFTTADGGALDLQVAGIIERSLPGRAGEALLVAWSDATSHFGALGADAFAIRFVPGQEERAAALVDRTATELALQPTSIDSLHGAAEDTLDRVFTLFDALAAIAVIVAGLGIVNTLTMNVIERVREIGVLRAVGMTRRQVWRMVVVEAGILGVIGVVLGGVTGVVVGVVMIGLSTGAAGIATIQVPWAILGLAAVYGIVVAMLAAAYPARVAAGMSIVRAVQYE